MVVGCLKMTDYQILKMVILMYIIQKKFIYKGKIKKVGSKVVGISKEDIQKFLNIGWIKKEE